MNDKEYTIAKFVGEPKQYPEKDKEGNIVGQKTRFAFTTNETGEQVISLFTKYPDKIKPGATIFGHIEEQEKDGKTYHNFFFGKNPNKGGMTEADRERMTNLENKVTTLTIRFNKLMSVLVEKGILEMPEEKRPVVAGTTVEYPESIDPSDIPFD